MIAAVVGPRYDRLLWGLAAILAAVVLARLLKRLVSRLEQRQPGEERELQRLRTRETAIVLIATAIPYATAIVVAIVIAATFLPGSAAALGGSAFIAVIVGFAAQRFLMDVIAGALMAFERWYGVGDFVIFEPTKAGGIVEQFGFRTTVVRGLNGDQTFIPNSQIIGAIRPLRGYRRYSIEILASDPEEAKRALEGVGRRSPVGEARFLRPPHVVEQRELGEGTWLIRGRADVAPTMEWLVDRLLVDVVKSTLSSEVLLADPIVYTLDEGTLSRYERRVLVR
jgi:small conductance mechanosensitive channel